MTTMRFTVVDDAGALSFLAPPHVMKMLAAACSAAPNGHRSLFEHAETYDPRFFGDLIAELDRGLQEGGPVGRSRLEDIAANRTPRVGTIADRDPSTRGADERDVDERSADVRGAPLLFRVVDESTRRRSLDPGDVGLIVYNLVAKRIVQVHNSYSDLLRKDRGRLRRDGRPVRALYRYDLPDEWSIVP